MKLYILTSDLLESRAVLTNWDQRKQSLKNNIKNIKIEILHKQLR